VRHRLLTLLLALALAAGLGAARPAVAHATGANDAIAINTKDDSSLFKFAWAIRHIMSDTVTEQNGSAAYAQCDSCQTTAIAIEIVLAEAPTTTNVSPTNVAIAINENCNLCDTFATAYQFVILSGGSVRFTQEGIRELHEIRKEIQRWGKEGLTNEEIRARLPDVIARLKRVLATQLVPVGNGEKQEPDESATDTTEGTPATPTGPTSTTETGSVTTTTPTTTTAPTTTTTTETTPTDTTTTGTTTTTP
jgi:putative peptide zinc metalloprotease protein